MERRMFAAGAIAACAFLVGANPHVEVAAVSGGFDWNHVLQIVCTALAAYFGSRQNKE